MSRPGGVPKAKRISLFSPNLGGGGAERVTLACANDLIRRGHEVDLVLIRAGGELMPLLSPKVHVVEFHAQRMIASLAPMVRYLRERRPDALHAFMWPTTIIAILAHRLARSHARLVVSDHTNFEKYLSAGSQTRQFHWTTRLFYPLADVRIACSAAAADGLARLSGMARSSFEVIYSPIVQPAAIATNAEVERLWAGSSRRIINVGSMNTVKNQALLIRAFERLSDPEARLLILGDGPERARLEALVRELGLQDRIMMPGFVLDPWPYLASAELFVLASNYEGSPVALAEAMYAGLAVVSTNCVSGPAELLDGGRFGRLVPCNDEAALAEAIAAALAEPRDPGRMRQRALEMTGPQTIERYAELVVPTGAA